MHGCGNGFQNELERKLLLATDSPSYPWAMVLLRNEVKCLILKFYFLVVLCCINKETGRETEKNSELNQ